MTSLRRGAPGKAACGKDGPADIEEKEWARQHSTPLPAGPAGAIEAGQTKADGQNLMSAVDKNGLRHEWRLRDALEQPKYRSEPSLIEGRRWRRSGAQPGKARPLLALAPYVARYRGRGLLALSPR